MKRIITVTIVAIIICTLICTLSSCAGNPSKDILGKWYNEEGDCLVILSDNTYYIDFAKVKLYGGYVTGTDSGMWKYLEEEKFFKFYANNYDEYVYKIKIEKDSNGKYIKYASFGTFYKK